MRRSSSETTDSQRPPSARRLALLLFGCAVFGAGPAHASDSASAAASGRMRTSSPMAPAAQREPQSEAASSGPVGDAAINDPYAAPPSVAPPQNTDPYPTPPPLSAAESSAPVIEAPAPASPPPSIATPAELATTKPVAPRPPRPRGGGMMAAGFSILGAGYLTAALTGSILIDTSSGTSSSDSSARTRRYGVSLLVPAIGPFIALAHTRTATGGFMTAMWGILQSGGLALAITGVSLYARDKRKHRELQARLELGPQSLRLRF